LAQLLFIGLEGIAFIVAGVIVNKKKVANEYSMPVKMFSLWWTALGTSCLVWVLDTILINEFPEATGFPAVLDYVLILAYFVLILIAFASLFYYLLFLYFGSEKLSKLVWGIYGGVAVVLMIIFGLANNPATFHVTGLFEKIYGPYQAVADLLQMVLLLPVIIASVALFTVYRRMSEPTQKYRILMLSTSLTFYLIMPLFFPSNPGVVPQTTAALVIEIMNKVGAFIAVTALYMTYYPPKWIRSKYGVSAIQYKK
jgi:hypothetical protein